ncbi:MAG: ribosome silencing factor [Fibrobacterota bacterium]
MIKAAVQQDANLCAILNIMLENKAENITVINTGETSSVSDWTVICEGTTFNHVRAVATDIKKEMKAQNNSFVDHTEGQEHNRWILLDYIDIVVHIMLPELRNYYRIEEFLSENSQLAVDEAVFQELTSS